MIQKNVFGICLFFATCTLHAQQAMFAGGGEATGTGGSVSYSIGQELYHRYNSPSGSEAQEVHQPFELSETSTTDDAFVCQLYPNPTVQFLLLNIPTFAKGTYSYRLYDDTGKFLEQAMINSVQTTVNMSCYAAACYMLVVEENNKRIKTFKVIKY